MGRFAWISLVLGLGVALLFGVVIRERRTHALHGDDVAGFLSSACQARTLSDVLAQGTPPVGEWVSARTWRRYLEPNQSFCFGEISRGLAEGDVHPPLYFWLLHVSLLAFKGSLFAATVLNGVFALVTGALLYALGVRLCARPVAAVLAVLVWAVNPRAIEASEFARPYQLYGLATVWLSYVLVREVQRAERRGWRDGVPIALAAGVGLLSHYQFVLVTVAGAVYLVVSLGVRKSLPGTLGIGAGLLATNLIHPTFLSMLRARTTNPEEGSQLTSSERVAEESAQFVSHALRGFAELEMSHALAFGLTALLLVAVAAAVYLRKHAGEPMDAWFLLVPALIVFEMSLTQRLGVSPAHVGGPRYLSPVQPLMALLPAYVVAAAPGRMRELAASALVGFIAVVGAVRLVTPGPRLSRGQIAEVADACERVVIPWDDRLSILSAAFVLPNKVRILAGRPPALEAGLAAVDGEPVCMFRSKRLEAGRKFLKQRHVKVKAELEKELRLLDPRSR